MVCLCRHARFTLDRPPDAYEKRLTSGGQTDVQKRSIRKRWQPPYFGRSYSRENFINRSSVCTVIMYEPWLLKGFEIQRTTKLKEISTLLISLNLSSPKYMRWYLIHIGAGLKAFSADSCCFKLYIYMYKQISNEGKTIDLLHSCQRSKYMHRFYLTLIKL